MSAFFYTIFTITNIQFTVNTKMSIISYDRFKHYETFSLDQNRYGSINLITGECIFTYTLNYQLSESICLHIYCIYRSKHQSNECVLSNNWSFAVGVSYIAEDSKKAELDYICDFCNINEISFSQPNVLNAIVENGYLKSLYDKEDNYLNFLYSNGCITGIQHNQNSIVDFTYKNDQLISISDSRNQTSFEYEGEYLTKIHDGHGIYYKLSYSENKVTEILRKGSTLKARDYIMRVCDKKGLGKRFLYRKNETAVIDIRSSRKTVYKFNDHETEKRT